MFGRLRSLSMMSVLPPSRESATYVWMLSRPVLFAGLFSVADTMAGKMAAAEMAAHLIAKAFRLRECFFPADCLGVIYKKLDVQN